MCSMNGASLVPPFPGEGGWRSLAALDAGRSVSQLMPAFAWEGTPSRYLDLSRFRLNPDIGIFLLQV